MTAAEKDQVWVHRRTRARVQVTATNPRLAFTVTLPVGGRRAGAGRHQPISHQRLTTDYKLETTP